MARLRAKIRYFASAAVLAATLAGPAAAQQPADAAKLNQAIAEQKAAGEVDAAIQAAEADAKVSTLSAVQKLKAAQTALALATGIGSTKRDELDKKLDAKIAALQPKATGPRPAADPNAAVYREQNRQAQKLVADEAKEVGEGLKKYADLKDAGRPTESRQLLAALSVKYPNNPMVQAAGMQTYTALQIRADADYSKLLADSMLKNHRLLAESALPATGDITFMKASEWRELTKRRPKTEKLPLTEKEEGILKSLDTAIAVNFQDRPFEEALQDLSNKMNQELFIDKQSLKDAGVDLSRPVSFKGNVSARAALRAMLYGNQLTFMVKGEMIQVVTIERAEKELTTRSYYLGDLIAGTGPFGNAVVFGPDLSYQQMVSNADMLVRSVKDSMDPRCWKDNGGACSVTFHMPSLSLVVKASTEVHAMMGNSLSGGGSPKK